MRQIEVRANWDPEARVWVAMTEDVPGLVTEAETVELLVKKLSVMIPEMLEANGEISDDDTSEVPFSLIARSEQLISIR